MLGVLSQIVAWTITAFAAWRLVAQVRNLGGIAAIRETRAYPWLAIGVLGAASTAYLLVSATPLGSVKMFGVLIASMAAVLAGITGTARRLRWSRKGRFLVSCEHLLARGLLDANGATLLPNDSASLEALRHALLQAVNAWDNVGDETFCPAEIALVDRDLDRVEQALGIAAPDGRAFSGHSAAHLHSSPRIT